jgi:serine protease Do
VRYGFGEIVEKLRRSTVVVQANRSSGGSGVIWSSDGLIVTNAHVVEGAGSGVEVEFWDGRRHTGSIVRRDPRRDLALLHVEGAGFPAAACGDSSALRPGELVIAVGNPMGFIGAASTGIVHRSETDGWVVSQIRLAPGNSGGPLANARGEVVGINTMVAGALAFAIPAHIVGRFLPRNLGLDDRLGVVTRATPQGSLILEVKPGSPAERASLLQGDLLLKAVAPRDENLIELQFRRGGSANVRAVVVQLDARAKAA